MKVAVTGGTGFVGAHSVAALLRAGHDVRLLARRPERVAPALTPLGVEASEVVTGDATDPSAVERLLEGCDAVVHAAAVYSYDPRQTRAIGETNLRAAELVLGHAVRRGLDPVIHVSSIVSLFPGSGGPLTRRSEPGAGVDPYSVSKAASERLARTLQAGGAPVVSVLPGGVIGPDDPYLGETNRGIVDAVAGRSPLLPRGASIAFVDARDLAEVIARALEPGRGPRRYLVAPHYHGFADLIALARRLTGRRLPIVLIPDGFALVGARLADLVQRVVPFDLPLHAATLREVLAFAPVDDSDTWSELGIVPRPLEETFADTVRWAARAGHLAPRHLGRLQGAVPPILGA